MSAQDAFKRAIEDGDYKRLRQIHSIALPHLPAPKSDDEAEITMHVARTQSAWLADDKRCYSHAWLTERGLPSQLPDELKPKAQRLYPRVVEAVFVSANTNSPLLKPVAKLVQGAMSDAVEDCYANGDKDPALVRTRIEEARKRSYRELMGV